MTQRKKIFGIGITGLVGSRIVELLGEVYEFIPLGTKESVDITNKNSLESAMKDQEDAKIVLHLAAKSSVDGCEEDKSLGENGMAWKINVEGTRNVVEICKEFEKKLLYISTDFVFDGTKDEYSEQDVPNPINWYGVTKYEAEKIVSGAGIQYSIARIAYPYRSNFSQKKDFVRAILDRLQNKQKVEAVTDHIMTPTFIDDIAFAIDAIIQKNASGIFHAVGSQSLSPYDAACSIANEFGCDLSLISKTTQKEFFNGRATRPFCLKLKNDRILQLGVTMKTFAEGLQELKKQMAI